MSRKQIIEIQFKGIYYSLNLKNKTCKLISNNTAFGDILIPSSIKYKSTNYIIKSLNDCSFKDSSKIKSIQFSSNSKVNKLGKYSFYNSSIESIVISPLITQIEEGCFAKCKNLQKIEFSTNSQLQTIGRNAFYESSISFISIPPHVTKICYNAFEYCMKLREINIPTNSELHTIEINAFNFSKLFELKEGWCNNTSHLNKIQVMLNNPVYSSYDENKLIIGKSSITKENFDVLVFAVRNIKRVKIPSFIEKIGPYSFDECIQIQEIELQNESKLHTIEKCAFKGSTINKFILPKQITHICENAFYYCKFKKFEIPADSSLMKIETCGFFGSSIESIFIPHSLTQIDYDAFGFCGQLKIIEIDENLGIQNISQINQISEQIFKYKTNSKPIMMIPIKLNDAFKLSF